MPAGRKYDPSVKKQWQTNLLNAIQIMEAAINAIPPDLLAEASEEENLLALNNNLLEDIEAEVNYIINYAEENEK